MSVWVQVLSWVAERQLATTVVLKWEDRLTGGLHGEGYDLGCWAGDAS